MAGLSEKTPVLDKQKAHAEGHTFGSKFGVIMSCLGCAVGTGNVWRFPRMVALNSGKKGALCFLLPWLLFLFIWSIPMVLIEYSAGRYTRKGVLGSMQYFVGLKATWCGMWIVLLNLFIAGWYHVVAGWCMYYAVQAIGYPLPASFEESVDLFYNFADYSYWPILTQALAIIASGAFLIKGAKTIEMGNIVLVPLMLVMILVIFIWAMTGTYAWDGMRFMFTPDWGMLARPRIWVDAASQNAFDCAAGWGQFLTFAAFMTTSQPVVKYSLLIPMCNNVISLICGMMTFSTAFSSLRDINPNVTDASIIEILQTSGPGGTGMAFIWFPVLFQPAGAAGRAFAAVFFLSLVVAAISSLIAMMEVVVKFVEDYSVPRKVALPCVVLACFLIGLGSSLNLNILTNQDFTWGCGLLVSGIFLIFMVVKFGVNTYRNTVINTPTSSDWHVPQLWEWIIKYVAPLEAAVLLLWWFINNIVNDPEAANGHHWYQFGPESIVTVLIQWFILLFILIAINIVLLWRKPNWFMKVTWSAQSEPLQDGDKELDLSESQQSAESADFVELKETAGQT